MPPLGDPVNGCRWCGRDRRLHGIEWDSYMGYHQWTEPTDDQRRERIAANRRAT